MVSSNVILMTQIINALEESSFDLEESCNRQDKEKFDRSIKKVLELQKKLDYLITEVNK